MGGPQGDGWLPATTGLTESEQGGSDSGSSTGWPPTGETMRTKAERLFAWQVAESSANKVLATAPGPNSITLPGAPA